MGKGIYKDPRVPLSTRLLRALFSPPTVGAVAAAVAVRALPPALSRRGLVPSSGLGAKPWAVAVGAAAVGFGVGAASVGSLQWLRWKAIAILLSYHGWLFNQKAFSTKLWGVLLKLLVGPGPHRLWDFQSILPSLPVPELKDTRERFLQTVQPLLTREEFQHTQQLMDDFLQNDAAELQDFVIKRSKTERNWLSEWWMKENYLSYREPIGLNVNFFMMSTMMPTVSNNHLARSANVLLDSLDYFDMIRAGTLPPDMIMNMVPVCMDGARYMHASCRIPGEKCDRLEMYPDSTHSIVICNGIYFKMDMYPKGSDGKPQRINKQEMLVQLENIERQCQSISGPIPPVAALTSQRRMQWAKDRESLMNFPTSAATLKDIESSLFITVLSGDRPNNVSEQAAMALTGNGTSRWFDKSLTMETYRGSCIGGGNMEHSGCDATHFAVMWEHVLQTELYAPGGGLPVIPGQIIRKLPPCQRLHWDFDSSMNERVNAAYDNHMQNTSDMDCIMMHTEFGRGWMKKAKVSPDGFLQMAIQLAFYRTHNTFTKTYEPASHRLFALGRTDNINPVSQDSIDWVKMMDHSNVPRDKKLMTLKAAINYQSRFRLLATAGQGCDRHMMGLLCAAKELGKPIPQIFKDKAFNLPMRLSTSQVPTTLGHLGLDIVPESIAGGFGPVCQDGYGLLYVSIGENMFNVTITSWRLCPETDSFKFGEKIKEAMRDMRNLLENKDSQHGDSAQNGKSHI